MADHITLTDEDRAALRVRYREERDKRIRTDGVAQYIEPSAYLNEDTYTPASSGRPSPITSSC